MSTNQTKNLKLHSWAPLDRFTREEFNDNWAGIDAAWGELDGRILAGDEALSAETAARKTTDTTLQKNIDAEAATRKTNDDALQTKINAKADASALTTETNTRASQDTALGNRITAVEKRATTLESGMTERLRYVFGKYTGNGDGTKASQQDIKLNFKPKVVFVHSGEEYAASQTAKRHAFALEGRSTGFNSGNLLMLNDTGFTAYTSSSGSQLNVGGVTYTYLALG